MVKFMNISNKQITAIVKAIKANFTEHSNRVLEANRFPLDGFTAEVVESLKRIHPDLSPLSHDVEITIAFKNGAACNQWLTTKTTQDHLAVKQAVQVLAKKLYFHYYDNAGQKWKGLVKLKVGNFEIHKQYALAPGTIDPRCVTRWYIFQIADDGVSLPA